MLVGVCDFPSDYPFPPLGYGGIERWLWAVALGARQAGADVHLLGPQWRHELADDWCINPVRLEQLHPQGRSARQLRSTGYDLLLVGHEYPSRPSWRAVWESLGCDVATFQHWPYFEHQRGAFDGTCARMYCYSDQMRRRYAPHEPIAELAVHHGFGDREHPPSDGHGLLWLGRIDRQKAPHLAVHAAGLLDRDITIAGPVFDPGYLHEHRAAFDAAHVHMAGEVGDEIRTELLANATAVVYTCDRDYIEAGAAIFGESLRAGTPVAALAWDTGTCAHAALCERTGSLAEVHHDTDDKHASNELADAIERAAQLPANHVQEVGLARFDAAQHFRRLAAP